MAQIQFINVRHSSCVGKLYENDLKRRSWKREMLLLYSMAIHSWSSLAYDLPIAMSGNMGISFKFIVLSRERKWTIFPAIDVEISCDGKQIHCLFIKIEI